MSSRSSATRAVLRRSASLPRLYPGRLEIVAGDALELDPVALAAAPRKIVANLPYNIATPLLLGWLDRIGAFESLTLMFQREVAAAPDRDAAQQILWPALGLDPVAGRAAHPVRRSGARLCPAAQSDLERRRIVPRPEAAAPADKPRSNASPPPPSASAARCCARASKTLGLPVEPLLCRAGVAPTARAEELTVAEFLRARPGAGGRIAGSVGPQVLTKYCNRFLSTSRKFHELLHSDRAALSLNERINYARNSGEVRCCSAPGFWWLRQASPVHAELQRRLEQ